MARNLSIKSYEIMGIHKICPYETLLQMGAEEKIMHEVHFSGTSYTMMQQNIADPNQDLAVMIWFSAASLVGRPSGSKALMHGDDIYYIITWTDILGSGHSNQADLRRSRDRRIIHFLQAVTDPDHKQAIIERFVNVWANKNES